MYIIFIYIYVYIFHLSTANPASRLARSTHPEERHGWARLAALQLQPDLPQQVKMLYNVKFMCIYFSIIHILMHE